MAIAILLGRVRAPGRVEVIWPMTDRLEQRTHRYQGRLETAQGKKPCPFGKKVQGEDQRISESDYAISSDACPFLIPLSKSIKSDFSFIWVFR
jgi:hypothetical protein